MRPEVSEYLGKLCVGLQKVAAAIAEDTNNLRQEGDHIEVIKHFKQVRGACEDIKSSRKALDEIEEMLSREIVPDTLSKSGVKTIMVIGVGRVSVATRMSCSIIDKPRGYEWLRNNNAGGLIQETVNSSSLAAFARSFIEESGKELPDDVFKVSTMRYTSITSK